MFHLQFQKSYTSDLENTTIQKQRQELQLLIRELQDRDRELNEMVASHQRQLLAWEQDRQKLLGLETKCARYEGKVSPSTMLWSQNMKYEQFVLLASAIMSDFSFLSILMIYSDEGKRKCFSTSVFVAIFQPCSTNLDLPWPKPSTPSGRSVMASASWPQARSSYLVTFWSLLWGILDI